MVKFIQEIQTWSRCYLICQYCTYFQKKKFISSPLDAKSKVKQMIKILDQSQDQDEDAWRDPLDLLPKQSFRSGDPSFW